MSQLTVNPITILDVIFIVASLIICIHAAIRGFLDEVFGLGTFIIGAYGAFLLMPFLKPYLAKTMNDTLATILTFLILFVAIFLIMKIIHYAFKSIFSGTILKSLDHGLGFLFGIAESVCAIIIIFIVLEAVQPWFDTQALREASFFYNFFDGAVDKASSQILEHV
ncbi:CvpA family protein [Treponema sp.]|uniref:CvpA family protein n=1 Tax=Treponema sp. TaxID=166 RepID=UPI00298E06B3|nr:CvpA family protein [Treponema sp.]MCR5612450.1 CvpA family protein [Treponema sp.]